MGATDIERQKINVYRMQLLGASVVPVTSGSATLKDAPNEAMRDWVTHVRDTFYIIGTVAGPDPYPRMVRGFNAVVGREARAQMLAEHGRLPDAITACVGGGSNAIGIFHAFLNDPRSEEHTSELQSLMHHTYAVFSLKKKQTKPKIQHQLQYTTTKYNTN